MATAGHAKLRRSIVEMLLSDRQAALRQRNPSAAISASTKIADLVLKEAEEQAAKHTPISKLTHRIIHVTVCERCKERGAISDTPPPSPEPEAAKPRHASGWDNEPEPEPDPAPPAPVRQPDTIQVPKLPRTDRRRDRDNPVVKGLAWEEANDAHRR